MVVDDGDNGLTKNTEQFRILTARQHVRERIGMYMGSSSKEEIERFVLGHWTKAKYVPALSKMVDEILDNSIDEAIRTNFKYCLLYTSPSPRD